MQFDFVHFDSVVQLGDCLVELFFLALPCLAFVHVLFVEDLHLVSRHSKFATQVCQLLLGRGRQLFVVFKFLFAFSNDKPLINIASGDLNVYTLNILEECR